MQQATRDFILQVLASDASASLTERQSVADALQGGGFSTSGERWLTASEAAAFVRLGRTQFWALVTKARQNKIEDLLPIHVHEGGRPLWAKSALERHMATRPRLVASK